MLAFGFEPKEASLPEILRSKNQIETTPSLSDVKTQSRKRSPDLRTKELFAGLSDPWTKAASGRQIYKPKTQLRVHTFENQMKKEPVVVRSVDQKSRLRFKNFQKDKDSAVVLGFAYRNIADSGGTVQAAAVPSNPRGVRFFRRRYTVLNCSKLSQQDETETQITKESWPPVFNIQKVRLEYLVQVQTISEKPENLVEPLSGVNTGKCYIFVLQGIRVDLTEILF
ncbi:hypothetical protein R3P38DRAFT_2761013 [Favolaschia claudopus]|uniref:Uncharacterized protein n=1 Tax=Favolaschia claudopus TaxID=2862362 RepID=A0AAW0DXI7_9AGAR